MLAGAGLGSCHPEGSELADDEIPAPYLAAYQQTAADVGLPWTLLAAIGWVESRHNPDVIGPELNGGPGVAAIPATSYGTSLHGNPRWEHAVGMMQFLPDTFRSYRLYDAHDPFHPEQAVAAAGAYLVAFGARRDTRQALFAYNRSASYVEAVLDKAAAYDAGGIRPVDCHYAADDDAGADAEAVIGHPAVEVDAGAATALRHPDMDPRPIAVLHALADRWRYAISAVPDHHTVHLWQVEGRPVGVDNHAARDLLDWVASLQGRLRPAVTGSPWPQRVAGGATGPARDGHLHLEWSQP